MKPAHLLAVAVLAAACDTDAPVGFDPVVTNRADFFELQATGLSNVTTIVEYEWSNTGQVASVSQTNTLTSGTGSLDLLDGAGNVVYSRNLSDSGTFPSLQGTAGAWVVRLALTRVSGTVSFQVQKA